ncbi:hypothetical protein M3I54_22765 [Paraburkholderia sp. CNPSo 3274]|uniref:hypothetical protein n=1 Tax=Paraburkholderia sp. CNPSo 3274 TaxID=2940932 RepID=UPI0020B74314|nr:hypothetical protein [Paraburkholderia sp. CNPSo 3274]MCP3709770.1 hypothetical protein [Paraburkholderia sp. CNPSo 3274]
MTTGFLRYLFEVSISSILVLGEQIALFLATRFRQMRGAKVDVRADLMRVHGTQVAIAGLSLLRTVVALETARRAAAFDRAAMHFFAAARADDSGDATRKAKGRAGHVSLRRLRQ